ncbi:hypothetical protein Aduo_018684 [Ancylostoma duodenale]
MLKDLPLVFSPFAEVAMLDDQLPKEADFHPSVVGYMEIANTLLSSSLREVIVFRRERVLRSLGLDPYRAMPSYKRLPLAGTTIERRNHRTWCIERRKGYITDERIIRIRLNHKVESYCSSNYDPGTVKVGAFPQSWSGILGYAFPPFNLIGVIIRKAVTDGAMLILITPP